jgi:IS1 family transposase
MDKKVGEAVEMPVKKEPVSIVELDEMHSYVMRKNCCWTWIAVDRPGKRYVAFVCGACSTTTGKNYGIR